MNVMKINGEKTYCRRRCIRELIAKLEALNMRARAMTDIFFEMNLKPLKSCSQIKGGK